MIPADQLLLFMAAGLLLNLTPGPDLLYIAARSLGQGWRAGAASALGISAGSLVHTAAAAFGLSMLLRASPLAYELLRYAGAAYLIYLGTRLLLERRGNTTLAALPATPMRAIFLQGFLTNVMNPKVALFFLAFLPQFADAARGPIEWQLLLLGVIFTINGSFVCLAAAWLASRAHRWLTQRDSAAAVLEKTSGGMLVLLGVSVATVRNV